MAVLPEDLLDLAEEMLDMTDGLPDIPRREALYRSAVGRAYYAVYHAALALATRKGFVRPHEGYGSHEALWSVWFAEQEGYEDLAADGDALKRERHRADYRLRERFSTDRTRALVEDARRLNQRIKEG